jgi:hypothetical protein
MDRVLEPTGAVSINGGRYPLWSPKGNELYYVTLEGAMMAVPISLTPELKLGRPAKLFQWEEPPAGVSGLPYSISPTDGRLLVPRPVTRGVTEPTEVFVVLNVLDQLGPGTR